MRAVVQRCRKADLWIDDKIYSSIGNGLLVLLGIGNDDNENDI
jgi:D-tyrosyl-tRNA(Tyr) deacylase